MTEHEHMGATTKTVETWSEEKRTPAWLFAAARAKHRWPIGREVTEAEFDKAIAATKSIQIGS